MKKPVDLEVFPDSADAIFTPNFVPEWNQAQKAFDDAMATFWLGTRDARAMADDLQSRLEAFIQPPA